MNIEELKLLLDSFVAMGEAGKVAFIWWLVADKVLPALVVLVCVFLGLRLGRYAITKGYAGDINESRLLSLCNMMQLQTHHVTGYEHVTDNDFKQMMDWVRKRNAEGQNTYTIPQPSP